jgi:POT family proton-dependent oligopeptide transporter
MASRTDIPNSVDVHSDRSFFGHPRGLATLFFTEMWERFSYYGMRAILILFMTSSIAKGGLGYQDSKAGAVYGLYTAMVYLMCLAGGWVADLFTGQRRAVLYGGILIAAGEFALFLPSEASFYLGLVLLMAGTGMLKGNVSTIVGQLYRKGDPRRDSGFSIFYMGINIGALISPLICGYVGERISWRYGFGIAGLGMLIGVVQYVATSRHLGDAGLRPGTTGNPEEDRKQKRTAITAMSVGLAALVLIAGLAATGAIALSADAISDGLGWCLLGISALVFAWLIFFGNWSTAERKRSAAILVLFISSAVFWAAYEQAGSSLTLFAERNTNRHVFGFEFPASWYQFVQPLFVIALAPVFAWLWLAMRHREPSSPAKFTWGLLLGGLAFVLMVPAAAIATGGALVGAWWLVGCYFLQTIGELCLSPVGLSAMSKLAPERAAGFMMGIWFLSISIGNWMAGKAASLYSSFSLPTLFGAVAAFSLVATLVLALLIKPTVRLMGEVK